MSVHPAAASFQLKDYLAAHERKSLLRFITCGSVDDGKSTLIGRLLYESKRLFDDQLATLERDSRKHGTQGGGIDFALLVDGLASEREQGITIDVAYRFFSTDRRTFIVADTPGHEQYTRNMATGASTADVAILLIDARKGITRQTRRHALLVSMLGIRHVALAINKMDLVEWSEERFKQIGAEFRAFAVNLGFEQVTAIPLSALHGDNVVEPSAQATWYRGPTLLSYLETVEIEQTAEDEPFRLPVQWVNRPNPEFPRLCRPCRERPDPTGRPGAGPPLGTGDLRCADRDDGRRARMRPLPVNPSRSPCPTRWISPEATSLHRGAPAPGFRQDRGPPVLDGNRAPEGRRPVSSEARGCGRACKGRHGAPEN